MLGMLAQASTGEWKSILQDPTLTGVDLKKDVFITQQGSSLANAPTYTTILIHLTDSGKFISLASKQDKGFHRVHLAGKQSVASSGNTGYAWNDQLVVITTIKSPNDSSARIQSAPLSYGTLAIQKSMASLKGYDNSIFTTSTFFKTGMSDDADFHLWGTQGALLQSLLEVMKNKIPNGQAVLEAMNKIHTKTLMTLRFDVGKISFTAKTPLSQDTVAVYSPVLSRSFNPDLLARIPGGPLLAIMGVNFNFSAMGAYLEKFKVKEKVDSILGKTGLKFSDILNSFKGDFLFAAVAPEETGGTNSGPAGMPNFYFVTTIGDMTAFTNLTSQTHLIDTAGGESVLSKLKASCTLRDGILVVGRSKTLTDAFFTSSSRRSTDLVTPQMRKYPYNLAIDFKTVAAFIRSMNSQSPKLQQALHVLDGLDKFTVSMGALENNVMETSLEIKMADASSNSLVAIFNLFH